MDEKMKAVIDADFFRHITEHERGIKLFLHVMSDLGMVPVMHEFVAQTELKGNTYLQELLKSGSVSVVSYTEYLAQSDKEEYEEYFRTAFERINMYDFPEEENIYSYADQGESLGEIRSLYMAKKMGYLYFMSDDADARTLAKGFFAGRNAVTVKTLYDALIMCKDRDTTLRWKDINPTVTNVMRTRQDRISDLKKIYSEQDAIHK